MMQKNNQTLPPLALWAMWIIAAFFYFYDCLIQVSPSVMGSNIMHAFHLNASGLGYLAAIYFYAYASMQVPVGILLDRFGPRKLLTTAAFTCTLGVLIFGLAHHIAIAALGRLLIGLGSACAAIGCLKVASSWFPVQRFAILVGLMIMIGMLGATFGQAPLAFLVDAVGWRFTMMLFSIAGVILTLLLLFLVKEEQKPALAPQSKPVSCFTNLKTLIKNRKITIATLYTGLVFAPLPAFAALWGVPFLMRNCGLSKTDSAGLISLIYLGCALGSPLWSAFSNYIGKRRQPLLLGSVGACVSISIVLFKPTISYYFLASYLFLFGFFASSFLLVFAIVREITPNNITATTFGFANMLTMLGTAILQALIGYLLDLFWQGGFEAGIRIYSAHTYQMALLSIPLCFVLSLLLLPFLHETHCRMSSSEESLNTASLRAQLSSEVYT